MSLKTRFLLLATALILLASSASWVVFQHITESITQRWGENIAARQVRYDSARLLQTIEREIGLSRQLTDSAIIKRWASQPGNKVLERQAIDEMERFRNNFGGENYFVALRDTGAYYYNNARNEFEDQQLRYHLNPDKPADAWFYRLISEGRSFHLNVNPDAYLGVTKLWIDVLLKAEDRILGIAGTGIDLDTLLHNIVDLGESGVRTLFVNRSGAIQLYRDTNYIDYASIVKPDGQKKTIDLLLGDAKDRRWMQGTMASLLNNPDQGHRVMTRFVTVDGKDHLAGVAYLPSIDWYEITLLDLDVLLPASAFAPLALVFVVTLLLSLLVFNYAIRRQIIHPVQSLARAMKAVREGYMPDKRRALGSGEMASLNLHFEAMANSIRNNTQQLENTVHERTEALHKLARLDHLTELLNRRGMNELLESEIDRAARQHSLFGVIWLDLDCFKEVNDQLGHGAGDQVLREISDILRTSIRPYDHAARWGGDEFLVVLAPCDDATLQKIGERIRRSVASGVHVGDRRITVSIGACMAGAGDGKEDILLRADNALYRAKADGRNRFHTEARNLSVGSD
ncbi:diguanylate cyclase domain-containing protein [Marinobacter sp. 1Y8]